MSINYERLPPHLRDEMKRYIDIGQPTGGFLQAALENNLTESYARADEMSWRNIRSIIGFLYNEAPTLCYGSAAKVADWIAKGGLAGQEDGFDV